MFFVSYFESHAAFGEQDEDSDRSNRQAIGFRAPLSSGRE
jgi:hypothetical protein